MLYKRVEIKGSILKIKYLFQQQRYSCNYEFTNIFVLGLIDKRKKKKNHDSWLGTSQIQEYRGAPRNRTTEPPPAPLLSETYFNKHRYFLTAFSHIPRVLKESGTSGKKRGSMSTSLALVLIKYISGCGLRRLAPSYLSWAVKALSMYTRRHFYISQSFLFIDLGPGEG